MPRRRAAAFALLALVAGCDDLGGPWIGGIGAVMRLRGRQGVLVVTDVPPDTTAAAAGLRPGDRVTAIDGARVATLEPEQLLARLRGPVGTKVSLTVERGHTSRHLTIERAPYR